jgi:N utilization substance protein B
MKTSNDPRHLERIAVMQEIFAWDFQKKAKFAHPTSQSIADEVEKLDQYIAEAAPTWPIEKINKIDLAILRQAVYELMFNQKVPPKVVVDEAVEIAKEYGSDSSPSFINGALGKLISDQKIAT